MKIHHLLLATLGLGFAGCTLAEPEEANGSPASMQLSEVRCFGLKIIDIDRDAQGRVTTLSLTNEERIKLDYVGSSTTPATVAITWWDEIYDDDDRSTLVVDEETTWTNIRTNSAGSIISYDYYSTSRNQRPETGKCVLTYNAKNQLTKEIDSDGTVYDYIWKNDCLIRIVEDGVDDTVFEYSAVENTNGQWDPIFEFKPLLNITGLFGSAPKMFAKKTQDRSTAVQTAYSLLPNGLINHLKVVEVDKDESVTSVFNFVYEKK